MAENRRSVRCSNNINRAITIRDRNTQRPIISMACRRQRSHTYRIRLCRCQRHSTPTTIKTISKQTTISSAISRTQMPTVASSTTTIRSIIIRRPAHSPVPNWFTIKINFSATIVRPLQPQRLFKHRAANLDSIITRRMCNSKIFCHFWATNAVAPQHRRPRKCQLLHQCRRSTRQAPANHLTRSRRISNSKISSVSIRRSSSATTHRARIKLHRPRKIAASSSSHSPRPRVSSSSVVCITTSTIIWRRANSMFRINIHQPPNSIDRFTPFRRTRRQWSTINYRNSIKIASNPRRLRHQQQVHQNSNTNRTSNTTICNVNMPAKHQPQRRPFRNHTIRLWPRNSRRSCLRNTTRRQHSSHRTTMWPNRSTTISAFRRSISQIPHSPWSRRRLRREPYQMFRNNKTGQTHYHRRHPPRISSRPSPSTQRFCTMVSTIQKRSTKTMANIIRNCMNKISRAINWRINENRNWRNSNNSSTQDINSKKSSIRTTTIVARRTVLLVRATKNFWIRLIRRTLRPAEMSCAPNMRPNIQPALISIRRHANHQATQCSAHRRTVLKVNRRR